jgi:hypothetical protein
MDSPTEYATGQHKKQRNKGQYFRGCKKKRERKIRGRGELIKNEECENKRHQNNGRRNEHSYMHLYDYGLRNYFQTVPE